MTSNEGGEIVPASELAMRYREAASRSADTSNPKDQNQWADRLHSVYRQMEVTPAGRDAIAELLDDIDPHVAGWAAAHSLKWAPERARKVLERIRDGGGRGAISAKWTLREYERGTLSFDY